MTRARATIALVIIAALWVVAVMAALSSYSHAAVVTLSSGASCEVAGVSWDPATKNVAVKCKDASTPAPSPTPVPPTPTPTPTPTPSPAPIPTSCSTSQRLQLRNDVTLDSGWAAALAFTPTAAAPLITISKGHSGMNTPEVMYYQVSEKPCDFTPTTFCGSGAAGTQLYSATMRTSIGPGFGTCVLDPAKTYYFNFRFDCSSGTCGAQTDWF